MFAIVLPFMFSFCHNFHSERTQTVYFSINVNTNAKFLLKRKKDNSHKAKIKPNYYAVLSPEISWKILHMPVDSFLGAMVG